MSTQAKPAVFDARDLIIEVIETISRWIKDSWTPPPTNITLKNPKNPLLQRKILHYHVWP